MITNKKPTGTTLSIGLSKFAAILLALSFLVISVACTKGPKTEENTNASKANQPNQPNGQQGSSTSPLAQQTLVGDTERTLLYIVTAQDDAKNKRWDNAAGNLRAADKELDSALSRKPRLAPEMEALKAAIERTIGAIERRDKDAESQLAELQIRIGAIKTNLQ